MPGTVQFWSNLTSFAAVLDDPRMLDELEKQVRNSEPEHRKRVLDEISTVIGNLTELKRRAQEKTPPTLVAGEMAHQAEKASG